MDIRDLDNDAWLDELVRRSTPTVASRTEKAAEHESLWQRTQEEVADGWARLVGDVGAVRAKYKAAIADGRSTNQVNRQKRV